MSKIIKKQDITVLIESTLKSAGIESKKQEIITESYKDKFFQNFAKAYKKLNQELGGDLKNIIETKNLKPKILLEITMILASRDENKFSEDYCYDILKSIIDGVESTVDVTESKSSNKPLINEEFQNEMDRFKKLTNYTFKK